MDQSLVKSIMVGAALFLTVAVLGIVVYAFNIGQDASKSGANKVNAITSDLNEQDYLLYDNLELSGSAVVNALKKLEADGKGEKIGVQVITGANASGTWYYGSFDGDKLTKTVDDFSKVYTIGDNEYVNPSGKFKGSIKRDKNNMIRAIIFTQQ